MRTLEQQVFGCIGNRSADSVTVLDGLFDPRKGHAGVIDFRPMGRDYRTRVTLPYCSTREESERSIALAIGHLCGEPIITEPLPILARATVAARGENSHVIAACADDLHHPLSIGAVLQSKATRRAPIHRA